MLGFCVMLGVSSCRRLNVRANLEDIEWVIVACHSEGFDRCEQWVSKLTPDADAHVVRQLIAAINGAEYRGETETGGDGFVVFKLKGAGVQAFNFVPWAGEPQLEIRPGFRSKGLVNVLRMIGHHKIGWNRDDSLPKVKVKQIHVWQYGERIAVIRPDSPSFAPLAAAASEILKAFDPRWCMPNVSPRDPTLVASSQGAPQFILFLEEPLNMYKLIVWWKKPDHAVSRVRYKAFASSVIAIYTERFGHRIGFHYLAFLSDKQSGKWYGWDFTNAYFTNRKMGKPDAHEAFKNLLEVYEKIAPTPR